MSARIVCRGCIVGGLLGLLSMLPGVGRAQVGMPPGGRPDSASVNGVGSETLQRPPARLRMLVELLGKGKTLEEALSKLKDRREAALLTLESLKPAKESVSVGEPGQSAAQANQRRQMEQMIRQRMMGGRGRKSSKPQLPASVTTSALLIAEWPLEGDTAEKRLLAAQAIQDKVKAADLAGAKEAQKLSPEEEELQEESAEMMGNSDRESVAPGTPQFMFVARISPEERQQALARAFGKAKAHATRLAQAAGAHLGPLLNLSDVGGMYGEERPFISRRSFGGYGPDYGEMYVQQLLGENLPAVLRDKENEVMGPEPGNLHFGFQVTATFALAP